MGEFRKKPVVIEAHQWSGSNWHQILDFASRSNVHTSGADLFVDTLEGILRAAPGDWIIRGVQGEFYPCKPDIFEATYEPAEDPRSLDDNPHPGVICRHCGHKVSTK